MEIFKHYIIPGFGISNAFVLLMLDNAPYKYQNIGLNMLFLVLYYLILNSTNFYISKLKMVKFVMMNISLCVVSPMFRIDCNFQEVKRVIEFSNILIIFVLALEQVLEEQQLHWLGLNVLVHLIHLEIILGEPINYEFELNKKSAVLLLTQVFKTMIILVICVKSIETQSKKQSAQQKDSEISVVNLSSF